MTNEEEEAYREVCGQVTEIIASSDLPDVDQCLFGFLAGLLAARGMSKANLREMLEEVLVHHPEQPN